MSEKRLVQALGDLGHYTVQYFHVSLENIFESARADNPQKTKLESSELDEPSHDISYLFIEKKQVIQNFIREYRRIFQPFYEVAEGSTDSRSVLPNNLELIEKADADEYAFISSSIMKIREHADIALTEATNFFNSVISLRESNVFAPIDPACLYAVFQYSISHLSIEPKAKMLLLQYFDRYVIGEIPHLLKKIADRLQTHGFEMVSYGSDHSQFDEMLSEHMGGAHDKRDGLRDTLLFSEASGSFKDDRDRGAAFVDAYDGLDNFSEYCETDGLDLNQLQRAPMEKKNGKMFDYLCSLVKLDVASLKRWLDQTKQSDMGLSAWETLDTPYGEMPCTYKYENPVELVKLFHQFNKKFSVLDGKTETLSTEQLDQLLASIQSKQSKVALDPEQRQSLDVYQAIGQTIKEQYPFNVRYILNSDDELSINLVSLLFHLFAKDPQLPLEIQSVLERAKVHVLRAVLYDKTIIDEADHPARSLLEALSEVGGRMYGICNLASDATYIEIERIVELLLSYTDPKQGVFETLLDEFNNYCDSLSNRISATEKRTCDLALSRAKLANVKLEVDTIINAKIISFNGKLPTFIEEFLRDDWSQLLTRIALVDGVESVRWHTVANILDRLLWSLRDDLPRGEKGRWNALLPLLKKNINNGMNELSMLEPRKDAFFKKLNLIYKLIGENFGRVSEKSGHGSVIGDAVQQERHEAPAGSVARHMPPEWQDIGEGCWFRFVPPSTGTPAVGSPLHAKLALVMREPETYVFVNAKGQSLGELTKDELIDRIEAEQIVKIESGQLFERTTSSLIMLVNDIPSYSLHK